MQWIEVPNSDWAAGLFYNEKSDAIIQWRANVWQLTLDYIMKHRNTIDVFLCYLHPKQIDVNAIKEIKKLGIPCVNFYCDNLREFNKIPIEFKVFDINWVPEYEALVMYQKANIKAINLPMPMWVDKQYRHISAHNSYSGLSFIGSKDIYRENLLSEIIAKGIEVQIRGNGWLHENIHALHSTKTLGTMFLNQFKFLNNYGIAGPIIKTLQKIEPILAATISIENVYTMPNFDEYIKITQQSTIVLGINRVHTFKRLHKKPLIYSRLRDIEAPMLGACYITEYCEGLKNLYELETDILTYKTVDELARKTTELLSDKTKQKQLRFNAQNKALNEHSIPVSMQKLKNTLFK